MTEQREEMTVAEAGSRGGRKVRDEGLVDYQVIGRKGGAVTRDRYGPEHFAEMGRTGGAVTKQRHGAEHYQRIGRRGGRRVAELIAKARLEEGE